MTDEVKKDRRKKYKIPMIDPTRPAYYTSPKSPIDLDVVRDTAVVKYNFSEIEKDFTGKTLSITKLCRQQELLFLDKTFGICVTYSQLCKKQLQMVWV